MPRSINVAAVQLRAHDRADFARLLGEMLADVRDAASRADLVILPEATLPAYLLGDTSQHDQDDVARAIEQLRSLAMHTQTVIVAGAVQREGSALRNGAIVIDTDGSLAGRADKLVLWHFDRRWFEAGERLAPIATSLGMLGVLVCADGRIPTIARTLVDRGAAMLVMPTAWITSGRDPHRLENAQADLLARVRAYENSVPFVAANKCGTEAGMVAYCGKSQIVDADGTIVALASEREPECIEAMITIGDRHDSRVTLASPPERTMSLTSPLRIAISFEPLPDDVDRRIELLDDAYALAPERPDRVASLDRTIPTATVGDDEVLDPGGLVAYRRAGYRLAVWTATGESPWIERLARARALELRLYLIVFDRSEGRAFAVDPDGVAIAGTFDGYRMASFSFDPRKTTETTVAPGTDVAEALERIAAFELQ